MADTVICTYRTKPGAEDELLALLGQHRDVLRDLELATDAPFLTYLGQERGIEGPVVIELFEWADDEAAGRAHVHPRVSAVWERLEPLCEERGGRPPMEFPHFRPVSVP